MKYILEVRNPEHIEINKFHTLITRYVSMMVDYKYRVPVEVFETINERFQSLKKRERISMTNASREHLVKYETMDFNPSQDYFYIGLDIKDEDSDAFYQGRGALIPRIYNSSIKELNRPYYWLDQPALAVAFPASTGDDAILDKYGFYWLNGEKPIIKRPVPKDPQFVITMDYVRKGGQ